MWLGSSLWKSRTEAAPGGRIPGVLGGQVGPSRGLLPLLSSGLQLASLAPSLIWRSCLLQAFCIQGLSGQHTAYGAEGQGTE